MLNFVKKSSQKARSSLQYILKDKQSTLPNAG